MKELKMFINGKFVENKSGKWIDVLNPSTEEVISRQPEGTEEDAAAAVDDALMFGPSTFCCTRLSRRSDVFFDRRIS